MLRLNFYVLFLFSVLINSSCGDLPNKPSIYGVWEGGFRGKELMFEFKSDQTCVLSFKDKASSTVEILSGNFEMNFLKRPILLSVRNIPQLNHPLHTIIEFIGNDSIRLAKFSFRWRLRPISFDRYTSLNLKRINERK